jgi:hypothetical protein
MRAISQGTHRPERIAVVSCAHTKNLAAGSEARLCARRSVFDDEA